MLDGLIMDITSQVDVQQKLQQAKEQADAATRAELDAACKRLIGAAEMGTLFKVLALAAPSIHQLAGL